MVLHAFNANHFKLDGGAMFGVVPKSIWNKLNPADELNMTSWVTRCLLFESAQQLILFDTGIGLKQDAKFRGHFGVSEADDIQIELSKLGFSASQVTDVVFTHLHFDHCGGAVKWNMERSGYELTFPNAKYWTNESHWNWAINPNPREKASFLKENLIPIEESGKLNFVDFKHSPFNKIEFIEVSGHTTSMMLPLITVNEVKILFTADLFPSLAHLPIPYVMAYDMQPLLTLKEKTEVLQKALSNQWILCFGHDHVNECCTLQETEKGIRAKEIFELKSLF
jgi:glyoxylase-like metal-dependent hydrolase (beta-lactamase superfamily II)